MPAKSSNKRASSSEDGATVAVQIADKPAHKPGVMRGKSSMDHQKKPSAKPSARGSATQNGARPDLDIEYFRGLLLAERVRLEEEREQVRARALDMDNALPEEGEGADEDTADLAAAIMDKEMDLSVEDEIEDLLSAVDHALQKIEDGSYGVCDMSGEPIPISRLELIPWASLTVECQALSETD